MVGLWIRFELVAILLLLSVLTSPLSAAIVQSGIVEPNVNHWNFGTGYIGRTSDGSVLVDAGSALTSSYVYVGYNAGTAGTATVEGAGSKWVNTVSLNVGYYGNGSLAVAAGGQVSSATSYLGFNSGSTGVASVTGPGSRWTNSYELNIGGSGNGTLTVADGGVVITGSLYASLDDLLGNGSIIATGGVVDADLLFDAAHGNQAVLSFGSGGTLKVNAVDGVLGAGYKERGSMTVREGVDIRSGNGNLGFRSGSTGTAMVEGVGSSWSISNSLYVGRVGSGSLTIENGGQVGDTHGFVGYYNNSTGAAVVTGAGSQWTNGESLQVGVFGSGSLTIEAGGQVNNNNSFLGYYSGSTGTVAVTGIVSKWTNRDGLFIGYNARGDDHSGHAELSISSGGLVIVAGVISISSGDFLNIATGGMLALAGNADDSLTSFWIWSAGPTPSVTGTLHSRIGRFLRTPLMERITRSSISPQVTSPATRCSQSVGSETSTTMATLMAGTFLLGSGIRSWETWKTGRMPMAIICYPLRLSRSPIVWHYCWDLWFFQDVTSLNLGDHEIRVARKKLLRHAINDQIKLFENYCSNESSLAVWFNHSRKNRFAIAEL
jgi:T5SS/PEP-CTERM-associated repeat protein